jgi:hypothetical protein
MRTFLGKVEGIADISLQNESGSLTTFGKKLDFLIR